MTDKRAKLAIGQRLMSAFRAAGAEDLAPDMLLPADALLDLYGEGIRARAYVTPDPLRGEVMLRPDFTVPVVQMHMQGGAEPARYCYLGEVFRKQDPGDTLPKKPRDNEYLQAGFELFSRDPAADAELFVLFHRLLAPYKVAAVMGDLGLALAAVRTLPLSPDQTAALAHHLWRPKRFAALIARAQNPTPHRPVDSTAPWAGRRDRAEMERRLARLQAQAEAPALPAEWADWIAAVLAVDAPAPDALKQLRGLSRPGIVAALDRLDARFEVLAAHGLDVGALRLAVGHGRGTMEYYDGLTFSFHARPDWPPVAVGGRYDALTARLGGGKAIPAVGGIMRPGLLAELAETIS